MKNTIAISHSRNTKKLTDLKEFTVNPFLLTYLAYFFKGNAEYETLAKVLLYPRILGTSITTTFGTEMQRFITKVLESYGSAIPGIDIEFIDKLDGRKKYCQVKSGPNVLNKDDITTIDNHFKSVIHLSRTNNFDVNVNDMVFCLVYGEPHQKNAFIREVEKKYPVYIGKEFWTHLTGDVEFYSELVKAIGEVAVDINMRDQIKEVIRELAKNIESEYKDTFEKVEKE